MSIIRTRAELPDGRMLECEYSYHVTPGRFSGRPEDCYPDEIDVGAPVFWIEGTETDMDDMPADVAQFAFRLYMDNPVDADVMPEPEFIPDHEPDYQF